MLSEFPVTRYELTLQFIATVAEWYNIRIVCLFIRSRHVKLFHGVIIVKCRVECVVYQRCRLLVNAGCNNDFEHNVGVCQRSVKVR